MDAGPLPAAEVDETPGRASALIALALFGLALLALLAHAVALALLLGGCALGGAVVAARSGTLRRRHIIERWDSLIVGGHGQAPAVVAATLAELDRLALPSLRRQVATLGPSVLRRLAGHTRPFLIISHTDNRRLRAFRMYVSARDYGQTLQVAWFLTYQPRPWERVRDQTVLFRLDLFAEQDLRAYVTAVHRCFLQAVLDLLLMLGQDASQLNRSSKGFLGVS